MMRRAVMLMAVALALLTHGARGQWSDWSTNWTHAAIRSNLWAALGERIAGATEAEHTTNDVPAPGRWVSGAWLASFDARLTALLASYYDERHTNGPASVLPVLTVSNVLAYAGCGGTAFPDRGAWFPRRSDYDARRFALNTMTASVHAVAWTTNASPNRAYGVSDGDMEVYEFDPGSFIGLVTWTDRTDAVTAAAGSLATAQVLGHQPQAWSDTLFYDSAYWGHAWIAGCSVPAFLSWLVDEDGGGAVTGYQARAVATNWTKAVRLVWCGRPPDGLSPAEFAANGDDISTNWTAVGSDIAAGYASAWDWTGAAVGHTSLTAVPSAGAGEGSRGWVAEARWLVMWTADTNGFRFR